MNQTKEMIAQKVAEIANDLRRSAELLEAELTSGLESPGILDRIGRQEVQLCAYGLKDLAYALKEIKAAA